MRKPKWWNIDWVELGCRGWNIDVRGAGLCENDPYWEYAHLGRNNLDLFLGGRPAFMARVINDLKVAGLFQIIEESNTWNTTLDFTGMTCPTMATDTTTAASGEPQLKIVA